MITETNLENAKIFSTNYILHNDSDNVYTCTCCGKKTSIEGSISSKGYNLICNNCVCKMGDILNKSYSDIMDMVHERGHKMLQEVENGDNL